MRVKNCIMWTIGIFVLALAVASVHAQESWPDMKGVWTMTSSSVVIGAEKHHPGKVKRAKPRYREVKFTLRITEQRTGASLVLSRLNITPSLSSASSQITGSKS